MKEILSDREVLARLELDTPLLTIIDKDIEEKYPLLEDLFHNYEPPKSDPNLIAGHRLIDDVQKALIRTKRN